MAIAMRSIRKYLAPGLDLIALDPKLSSSIVGREAFASEAKMREVVFVTVTTSELLVVKPTKAQ